MLQAGRGATWNGQATFFSDGQPAFWLSLALMQLPTYLLHQVMEDLEYNMS